MRNIWSIFRLDASNLFRNVMSVLITVGLVVLPSLFAWYNILACWNVFDNTGNLSIAVASDDEGFTSDLMPVEVNVGDKVVSALSTNNQINWVITNSNDAIEGTKSGKYYAALVIPSDFSLKMLTFYEDDSESASIDYYVNEKVNAISPNITEAGADTVSYEVNAAFAETLSEISVGLAKSLMNQADTNDVAGQIAQLTNRMRDMADRIDQAAGVLGLYSSLVDDTRNLIASSATLVETARAHAESIVSDISKDKESIQAQAERLSATISQLSQSLENSGSSLSELESRADTLLAASSGDAAAAAAELRAVASRLDGQIGALNSLLATLEQIRDDLHSGISTEIGSIGSDDPAVIQARVEAIMERTALLDKAIASLSQTIGLMQQASSDLSEAAGSIESGEADVQEKVAALKEAAAKARSDIEALKADFDTKLKPDIETLIADLKTLASDFDSAIASLRSAANSLPARTNAAEGALGDAIGKINGIRDKLGSAAAEMRKLADSIDSALASGDVELLRSLLSGNSVGELASALSAPVEIDREALFPAQNFGSAMAPLYSALALFIGSLLIMVAMKPEVSPRCREQLINPKPRQLYFGRFGAVALLSLMQTTLLSLGNMFFLKVQVADPLLYIACFWISGLVFAFMIYTLVAVFGNLGKAVAVLLLIVQVTGCGGSYPLPIMPDFVQMISPYVPATHVVDALRAAMFGVYQNDFWVSMGKLLLFVIPFLILGLALRKPLGRVMHAYVSKVEESKLIK